MTPDDLPILGESLGLDLATTRQRSGEDAIDFLAHPALAALWLAHALPDAADAPSPMPSAEATALRALRDAAHALVVALWTSSTPAPEAVAAVNAHATAARASAVLPWTRAGPPSAMIAFCG